MARSIFFSFHYQRDIWRVNVVRNHHITKGNYNVAGYWDHSLWEETKRHGDSALERLIARGLDGTTVSVILIGAETARRPWVRHEIEKSYERGNGLLGIYIHNIENRFGMRDSIGSNPFDLWQIESAGVRTLLSQTYQTYDWVYDAGYKNFGMWVEQAARQAGR